jgi:inosine/xanthosine triphosphatase
MKIAIGTLRAPKIDGIKEGVAKCPYFDAVRENIEYITRDVSSDIPHMPRTFAETMQGAKNRARNVRALVPDADYSIGIEGGTSYIEETPFLYGCVYIENSAGEGHYGLSPMVEVPPACTRMIYEEGKELGPVMEELSGIVDIRSTNGSMGAWTDDMFTRKDEFVVAFQAGIAPFFNAYYRAP